MSTHFHALREECWEANRRLPATGLVDLTFGNVSVLDRDEDVFAIKPSGIDYETLRPADIVLVSLATGKSVEKGLRPSSDTPTHRRLFQAFTGVNAIVHTHSRHAVAFAQAGRGIPCLGTTHADYFHGEIPVTRVMTPEEVGGDYEWETGKVIIERFQGLKPLEVPAVLVNGHGPFAWAGSATKAVENARALEIVAEMAWKTLSLQPQAPPLPRHLLDKHHSRKHGAGAYYGQPG